MRKREKIEQDALIFRNVPAATLEALLDIRDLLSQEKPYPYPSTPVSETLRCKHGVDGTDCFKCFPEKETKVEDSMSSPKEGN